MKLTIPISIGELLDKITILQIKSKYSNEVIQELEELTNLAIINDVYNNFFLDNLYKINSRLWQIEDSIRIKEKTQSFDAEFIQLARDVYLTNDERAKVKKEINDYYCSSYSEIKLFSTSQEFD